MCLEFKMWLLIDSLEEFILNEIINSIREEIQKQVEKEIQTQVEEEIQTQVEEEIQPQVEEEIQPQVGNTTLKLFDSIDLSKFYNETNNKLQFESNQANDIRASSESLNDPNQCVQLNLGAYIIFNKINPPQFA